MNITWMWGEVALPVNLIRYHCYIEIMDGQRIDPLVQAMRDSPLFAEAENGFRERLLGKMRQGVQDDCLTVGWKHSNAYITVALQCPHCKWTGSAEIYKNKNEWLQNASVTQSDYNAVLVMLAAMLGEEA